MSVIFDDDPIKSTIIKETSDEKSSAFINLMIQMKIFPSVKIAKRVMLIVSIIFLAAATFIYLYKIGQNNLTEQINTETNKDGLELR